MSVTALEKACYKADLTAVSELLASGTKVTFEAFQLAVNLSTRGEARKRIAICRLFLDAGVDPNMPPPDGRAPIMQVAAGSPSEELLTMLIAAGGWVSGACQLHAAVGGNQSENIRVLLAAGADVNEPLTGEQIEPDEPIAGMTPLQYARHLKHKKCVAALS